MVDLTVPRCQEEPAVEVLAVGAGPPPGPGPVDGHQTRAVQVRRHCPGQLHVGAAQAQEGHDL